MPHRTLPTRPQLLKLLGKSLALAKDGLIVKRTADKDGKGEVSDGRRVGGVRGACCCAAIPKAQSS